MLPRPFAFLALALLIGAATTSPILAQSSEEAGAALPGGFPQLPPGSPKGYLDPTELPDSLALLPPPPSPDTPAFARDEATREAAAKLRDTPRWSRAISDADLHFPHAAGTFSCAADLPISKERMPHLYTLLGRAFIDVGFSTYLAKTHYQRIRPFVMHHGHTCTPADENVLAKDGSYPSGA